MLDQVGIWRTNPFLIPRPTEKPSFHQLAVSSCSVVGYQVHWTAMSANNRWLLVGYNHWPCTLLPTVLMTHSWQLFWNSRPLIDSHLNYWIARRVYESLYAWTVCHMWRPHKQQRWVKGNTICCISECHHSKLPLMMWPWQMYCKGISLTVELSQVHRGQAPYNSAYNKDKLQWYVNCVGLEQRRW